MNLHEEPSGGGPPVLDVDQIVHDLQQRVAERRARGEYEHPALHAGFAVAPGGIAPRPELAYSSKPIVGSAITGVKRALIRLQFHFLHDLATQMNAALAAANVRLDAEIDRRRELEDRIDELERRLESAAAPAPDPAPGANP